MKRKLIKTIIVDKANFEHIAKTGNINGTLLIEIERVMTEYARLQANGQQSEQGQLTIPDVSNSLIAYQKWCYQHPEYDQVCETSKVEIYMKGNL